MTELAHKMLEHWFSINVLYDKMCGIKQIRTEFDKLASMANSIPDCQVSN